MKKKNLVIDVQASLGSKLMCVGYKDAYAYENNTRSKNPIGVTYDIVLADDDKGFDHLDVTVPGKDEKIISALEDGNVQVRFDGLKISVSVYEGKLHIKAEAEKIMPVSTNKTNTVEQGGTKLGH